MYYIGRQKGFTLMEILIVIALISVISIFAVPGIMAWMPDYRLKKATQECRGDLQRAKLSAVKARMNCAVEFVGGDSATGYVIYLDANDNQEQDAGERVIAQVDWASDYDGDVHHVSNNFSDNGNGNGWFAFQPNGLPVEANGGLGMGTLRLNNDKGNWRSVVLSSAGNIKIRGSHAEQLH